MATRLFLLCPTDHLESTINEVFEGENFFYTSLGNSFDSDVKTLKHLTGLVKKHGIIEICFVLKDDNEIISDALGRQSYSRIHGMNEFYEKIQQKKIESDSFWNYQNLFSMLSDYLNQKIKSLQKEISHFLNFPILISGKVYFNQDKSFKEIYPHVFSLQKHDLN